MERDIMCQDNNQQFQKSLPGCWWGLFHVLDHHHGHHARRVRNRKGNQGRRRSRCCATPKTISFIYKPSRGQDFEDPSMEQAGLETTSLNNAPPSDGVTAPIKKEMSKEKIHKPWILSFLLGRHQRKDSILSNIRTEWADPIIVLHDKADTSIPKLQDLYSFRTHEELDRWNRMCNLRDNTNSVCYPGKTQDAGKQAQLPEFGGEMKQNAADCTQGGREKLQKYDEGMAGIFKIKMELLPNILQDSHVAISKNYDGHDTPIRKASFTKSKSFPITDSSGNYRQLRPSTLKHKQSEIWTFPKGEKPTITTGPKLTTSDMLNICEEKSVAFNDSKRKAMNQEDSTCSFGNSQGINEHGWNWTIMSQIKSIKQKIKHAFKDKKKENALADVHLDRTSPVSHISPVSEKSQNLDCQNETTVCKLQDMERARSIHESLDRYTQLFENSYGREPVFHHSRSLKLTDEDRIPSSRYTRKSFRRRLSLPDPESLSFLLNVISLDALCSDLPAKSGDDSHLTENDLGDKLNSVFIPQDVDRIAPFHDTSKTNFTEKMKEEGDANLNTQPCSNLVLGLDDKGDCKTLEYGDNLVSSETEVNSWPPEREMSIKWEATCKGEELSPDSLHKSSTDDKANPADFLTLEGLEPKSGCIILEEPNSNVNQPGSCGRVPLSEPYEALNDASAGMGTAVLNHLLKHVNLDQKEEADFNYVSHLLKLSGISESENSELWYATDQPLDPQLFKDLEGSVNREGGCLDEVADRYNDHQLLFDLANEALLEIYEQSAAYFPKAFSFCTKTRPIPKGHHLLQEVWKRVNYKRSLKLEQDQTLNDVIERDMAKGDCWLNFQWESECVAFDLEDLILDDLLNEIVCF